MTVFDERDDRRKYSRCTENSDPLVELDKGKQNMRPFTPLSALAKSICAVCAILALPLAFPRTMRAQYPPVPATFQPIYTELDNYLINFNATLPAPSGPAYPTLMTGALKTAEGNDGPGLLSNMTGTLATLSQSGGLMLQLNALKATGVQAILINIGFPMLYEPFMDSQGANYQTQFVAFYAAVANAVHLAGMKLIIENDTLLVNDIAANWNAAPFYATLNWTQYQQARAQTALTIAQKMNPDYMVLLQEPITEATDSGQANANTVSGSLSLLTTILASVRQQFPNLPVGAGTGTSQENSLSYIQAYVTLPLNFIDIHIYPINNGNLPMAQQMAGVAAAAGLQFSMSECWMWKVLDTELGVLTDDQIRARDPFSFWAPLDAYFIQTMQSLANNTQMLFMNPYGAEYYFAYVPYDDSTADLSPAAIMNDENAATSTANQEALGDTTTGMSYYNSIVVPPDTTPPTAPTGVAGVSGNPTETSISWNAATDSVGVAGYYILRGLQGNPQTVVGQTGELYFQDSGLTESATYTYSIEAFDLGGNVSASSAPVNVQTLNVTPPTTPGNVSAASGSCSKATVTWTASQDNTGVEKYLMWMGLSSNTLSQIATPSGKCTPTCTYNNYNLSPATTYYFGIQATDKNRNVSYMSAIVPVTTPALPVPPASVSATADSTTKVTVTWSPSTGGLPVAHYIVYRGTSPSSLIQIAMPPNPTYSDMSVVASTTYYYAIAAADSGNPPAQSGLSQPVSVTTPAGPSVPAGLTATPISCTKVTLAWSAATTGGGLPIGNYHLYKGTTASNLAQVAVTPNTTYTDTTDTAQTTYYYAVQSSDTGKPPDLSAISPPVAVTTFAYPSVPANLTAIPESSGKITLSWSASISGGLQIGNYHVYGGPSPNNLSQLAVTPNTTYNNVSLTAGQTYYYAVQATDTANDDSALSNTVQATTLQPPTTPSNVAAQGVSSSEITISWSPSSASGALSIARYYIFRGTSPTGLSQVGTTTSLTYNDRSLSPGTTYYYGVQAADTAGDQSAVSAPAAPGTTQP
jgi:fibronectin type 3 domain-containing protein